MQITIIVELDPGDMRTDEDLVEELQADERQFFHGAYWDIQRPVEDDEAHV